MQLAGGASFRQLKVNEGLRRTHPDAHTARRAGVRVLARRSPQQPNPPHTHAAAVNVAQQLNQLRPAATMLMVHAIYHGLERRIVQVRQVHFVGIAFAPAPLAQCG